MNVELFLFFVSHYGFMIGVAILSYGIGRKLTQRVQFDSAPEQIAFCTSLGLGVLSYLVFLVATLRILYLSVVLIAIGILLLLSFSSWSELLNGIISIYRQKYFLKWKKLIFPLLGTLFLFPIFIIPLYPPTAFDSTMYHLPYAKFYIQAHQMMFIPYLRYPVFPQVNEMLFTLSLLIYDEITAHLMQFLMMILLSIGLFAFGQRFFSQRSGIWAAAIFLSNPLSLWLGSNGYIEMGLSLFVTMGIYAILNWLDRKEKSWLILGATFIGISAGSKYSALFFLAFVSLVTIYIGLKDRKLQFPFIFLLIAIGVAFPWYFRNWFYTEDPFYLPFFSKLSEHQIPNIPSVQNISKFLLPDHGPWKSQTSFIILPWDLAFHQSKFFPEASYSPIYLYALPFLLISLSHSKIRMLWIIVFLYTLFWFKTVQTLRYLIPIIPILSLTVAASFKQTGHIFGLFFSKKVAWMKSGIFTFVISILFVSPGWFYTMDRIKNEGSPPYTKNQKEAYLTKKLPSFPAYQYLNKTKGRNYTLYALFDENMAYFADGTFMGDWFGPARFKKIYTHFSNVQSLYDELKSFNANFFLIRKGRIKMKLPEEDEFPSSCFRLVMKNNHFLLYEIL